MNPGNFEDAQAEYYAVTGGMEDFPDDDEREGSYCPRCEEFKDDLEVFHEMPDGDYVCQSCYESEIDAVHDMMKDRLYEGE